MRDALAHRGSRAGTLFLGPGAGLSGHSDCSDNPLPCSSSDGRYTIAWDGTIDRLDLLSNELGPPSRRASEILIEGYSRWGEHLFEKLEGAFALALWDAREKQLFLACDRLGRKSLYWRSVGPYVYFASHLSALLQATERKAPMDIPALDSFLYHGAVPRDRCIFQGIEKLLPAHWMQFIGEQKESRRYWKLEFEPGEHLSEAEWLERTERLLVDILRETVPPGKSASIIMDDSLESALLVPLLRKAGADAVKTIEVNYTGKSASRFHLDGKTFQENREPHRIERPKPASSPARMGSGSGRTTGGILRAGDRRPGPRLRESGHDSPLGSGRKHRSGRTGSGLAGGDRGKGPPAMRRVSLRKFLFPWVAHRLERRASGGSALKAFCEAALRADLPAEQVYRETEGWTFHRRIAYRNKVRGRIAGLSPSKHWRDKFLEAPARCDVDRMISTDYAARLPDRLLPPLDLAASRHGLSIRCPFLDSRFIEAAARIPPRSK
jgi:asparagine synthase (glutamine-hydrolysing)